MLIGRKATSEGLKWIGAYQALKGVLALAAALGYLRLAGGDLSDFVEDALLHLHFDPKRRTFDAIMDAVEKIEGFDPRWVIAIAGLYAAFRFVEGYGLWRRTTWGEWVAIVSTGVYIPLEAYEVAHAFSWLKLIVINANLGVLAFVVYAFRQQRGLASAEKTGDAKGT